MGVLAPNSAAAARARNAYRWVWKSITAAPALVS